MIKLKDRGTERVHRVLAHGAVIKKNANLSNALWNDLQFDQVAKHIENWTCQSLNVENNKKPSMVKMLVQITFSNLHTVILAKNRIQSIQLMCRCSFHHLTCIDLSSNLLTTIKTVRKVNCPNLSAIHLEGNPISQSVLPFQSLNLQNLVNISTDYYFFQPPVAQDIRYFAKMNAKKPSDIYTDSSTRIVQKKVMEVMKKKYEQITIGISLDIEEEFLMDGQQDDEDQSSEKSMDDDQQHSLSFNEKFTKIKSSEPVLEINNKKS